MKSLDPRTVLKNRLVGKTQDELAKELGIGKAYLSDILNFRREPGPTVLRALGLTKIVTYQRMESPLRGSGA